MQKQEYHKMSRLEDKHWWFLAKRQFIKSLLPHKTDLNILDLGCGTGGTTRFLSYWGKVTGVEKEKIAVQYLHKKGVKFINKPIDEADFPKNKFDLICILDVLYHQNIASDLNILMKSYNWLKKGGYLVITDSACPSLYSNHDRIMMARQRYSLDELTKKVRQTNFTVIRKSYIYFFLFPLFLFSRLLNKFVEFSTVKEENKIINGLFLKICKIEAFLLRFINFPIGSSVIILAKK